MKDEAGYTLAEVLIATLVMLTASGAIFRLLDDGVGRSTLWNESADLHQRGRVGIETLTALLASAGAGTPRGVLPRSFAAVEPRRRTTGSAGTSAITVRSVPAQGAWSRLAGPLAAGAAVVGITPHPACPVSTACGFEAGMDAIVFDALGNWDTVLIQAIGPDSLTVVDRAASRSIIYPPGADIAQVVETTLYLDSAQHTLRREHPGASDLPLLDNVVALRFEYFGDPSPPVSPHPPPGVQNCLYATDGAPVPLPALVADHGTLSVLPVGALTDGPMCGSGATAYDVDLLRIRKIRATIRLQAGIASLRGADPLLFLNPGSATVTARMLPDLNLVVDVAPRNLHR
jgi:hypothetical protein